MRLDIVNVTKHYGKHCALNKVSVSLEAGVHGILGENGAGKSTLIHLVTDNLKRETGEILWDGTDILKLGVKYLEKIGFMSQHQGYYEDFTGKSFLHYMGELKGLSRKERKEQCEKLLQVVNLSSVANKKIRTYSGGMKQRILLAQALLGDPELLVLDEPTTGLDPMERKKLCEYIKERGKNAIVLMASHVLSDFEDIADSVIILKNGELLTKGSIAEMYEGLEKKQPDRSRLEQVYMHYYG